MIENSVIWKEVPEGPTLKPRSLTSGYHVIGKKTAFTMMGLHS